jgi:hypothetical protein
MVNTVSTPTNGRQNVRVVCRIRPTNQIEIAKGGRTVVQVAGAEVVVDLDGLPVKFTFDSIFEESAKQEAVYIESASDLVDEVLKGYNATSDLPFLKAWSCMTFISSKEKQ